MPVEAPLGTAALKSAVSVQRSTSTVGFPRESKISRARMPSIFASAGTPPAGAAATAVWFLTASAAFLIASASPR